MVGQFDVMLDDGDRYYGTVKADIETKWKMKNGRMVQQYDRESVMRAVYAKYPTLRGKFLTILPCGENKGEL